MVDSDLRHEEQVAAHTKTSGCLADIYELVFGSNGREAAEQVLAARRRQEAGLVLAAPGDRSVG